LAHFGQQQVRLFVSWQATEIQTRKKIPIKTVRSWKETKKQTIHAQLPAIKTRRRQLCLRSPNDQERR
jgi:hypothetical protein